MTLLIIAALLVFFGMLTMIGIGIVVANGIVESVNKWIKKRNRKRNKKRNKKYAYRSI